MKRRRLFRWGLLSRISVLALSVAMRQAECDVDNLAWLEREKHNG